MRFRFFCNVDKKLYRPEQIQVTFRHGGFQVQMEYVMSHRVIVLTQEMGILLRSSEMMDKQNVEAFDGDVLYFPHFKKDGKRKNGGAYRRLEYLPEKGRWNMRSISRGLIVGNAWEGVKKQ